MVSLVCAKCMQCLWVFPVERSVHFFQIISLFLHSPFCRARKLGQNLNLGHLAKMSRIRSELTPNFRLWSEKRKIYDFALKMVRI